jgi:lipid-A-disaccharide synthase
MLKLLVSALEPSANLHLEPLLNALETYEIYGIFDERFGKPLMPSRAFSIMGFSVRTDRSVKGLFHAAKIYIFPAFCQQSVLEVCRSVFDLRFFHVAFSGELVFHFHFSCDAKRRSR